MRGGERVSRSRSTSVTRMHLWCSEVNSRKYASAMVVAMGGRWRPPSPAGGG
jgi:hypothetical protein